MCNYFQMCPFHDKDWTNLKTHTFLYSTKTMIIWGQKRHSGLPVTPRWKGPLPDTPFQASASTKQAPVLQQRGIWCFVIPHTDIYVDHTTMVTLATSTLAIWCYFEQKYDWSCWVNSSILLAFLATTFFFSLFWRIRLGPYSCFHVCRLLWIFYCGKNGTHKRSQPNIMQAFAVVNIPGTLPLRQHLRVKERPVVKMLSFLRGEKWCSHDLKDGITQKEHWL